MTQPYLYEVLIRGTATGIAGAHVIYAADSINSLTGEARTDVGPARPLSPGDGLAQVLTDTATLALQENAAVKSQLGELSADLHAAQAETSRLRAEVDLLQAALRDALQPEFVAE